MLKVTFNYYKISNNNKFLDLVLKIFTLKSIVKIKIEFKIMYFTMLFLPTGAIWKRGKSFLIVYPL